MLLHKRTRLIIATALLLLPTLAFATPADNQDKIGDYNVTLLTLVSLMLILLFVIGMLGNTLRQLSFFVRDKIRKDKKEISSTVKTILILIALSIPAIRSLAADAVSSPAVSHTISGIPEDDFYWIMLIISLEIVVIFALVIYIRILLRVISGKPELAYVAKTVAEKSWFWDKFNAAASIEREKDILLDHNYDGIQELDNSLPPWWKYGFYLTIIVAVIYLYRFHISHDGQSSQEEFVAAMQQAEEDKAAYLAKSANNVDESNVVTLSDPNEIAAGKDLFVKTCAACHLADGGGTVGPNLTDDYWLHGGGIKDIFKSIKYGWQDKGMKSWKDDFSPKQIAELASFIRSLKGTHPAAPKVAQGDLYIEASQGSKSADSTGVKIDSIKGKVAAK